MWNPILANKWLETENKNLLLILLFCVSGNVFNCLLLGGTNTHLSWRKDVVHVFQETLIFDFIVCEDEGDPFALLPSCSVQEFQVFQEIGHIVRSATQGTELIS